MDQKKLSDLSEKIRACKRCTLWAGSRGKVVGDIGEDTRVVFVGEAPGEEEDKQGRPFVGRSGELLRDWIKETGMNEKEYTILNVVKCRPPGNRKPIEAECSTCGVWLRQQLAIIGCKRIVIVGGTAADFFLGGMPFFDGKILKYVGDTFVIGDYRFFILPHPAYVLRNGGDYSLVPMAKLRKFCWGVDNDES